MLVWGRLCGGRGGAHNVHVHTYTPSRYLHTHMHISQKYGSAHICEQKRINKTKQS